MQLLNERLLHLALTSSVAILKSGISSYTGICQFRSPKKAKKKFLCSNFRRLKSVQYKEKWAVDVFRNWQAAREKNHTLYSSREACSKCAKA